MERNNEEEHPWIIRFTDGTLASCYGTIQKAKEQAEEKKDLHGGSYIIT